MSAYREQAEQSEPEATCAKCGVRYAVTPGGWHICRIEGENLDRVLDFFGVHREPHESDEAARERLMRSMRRGLM